jgi:hypothetical protein
VAVVTQGVFFVLITHRARQVASLAVPQLEDDVERRPCLAVPKGYSFGENAMRSG